MIIGVDICIHKHYAVRQLREKDLLVAMGQGVITWGGMVYCPVCGRGLPRGSSLCSRCGPGLGQDASVASRRDATQILGIDGMSREELALELRRGGRFITYQFCVSTFIMACSVTSDIFFYRAGESTAREILHYCTASLLLGWWGLPWGPVFTIRSLVTNLKGGTDVTREVVASLQRQSAS